MSCDHKTVACQAPLFMGFSRREYWSGLPFSTPGNLPNPGIKLTSPPAPILAGGFFTTGKTWLGGKESACHSRSHRFNLWVGKIPWSRKWQPTPVLLPGKSHGQRSLAGCNP